MPLFTQRRPFIFFSGTPQTTALTAWRRAIALGIAVAITVLPPTRLARAAVTPAEIQKSIERGKQYLYRQQKAPGRWEGDAERNGVSHNWSAGQGYDFGGFTAIATYALLAAGDSPQSEELAPAIEFLKRADMIGAYALGLRCQVWTMLPRPHGKDVEALLKSDAKRLLDTFNTQGPGKGLWDYEDPGPNSRRIDHSVGQYGVLGLWACAQEGVAIPNSIWSEIDETWRLHQAKDGGWTYSSAGDTGPGRTMTMTAAGVATLFITQDYLHANDGLECTGNVTNPNIEAGLQFMVTNFQKALRSNYGLYGIERIGAASGYKYFGGTDWYAAGAEHLVKSQKPDGSWGEPNVGNTTLLSDTAFAILFLSRGRAPVLMNKLDYSAAGNGENPKPDWNQRPRDAANATRWIGMHVERYFHWQIVNLTASAEELLDAPILYVAGDEELKFTDEEVQKLKQFVQAGGLILGSADCGKEAFAESFTKLGKQMFPAYDFRALPPDHPILSRQQFSARKWKSQPELLGLSNGVREFMLLAPQVDLGRAWQTAGAKTSNEELLQLAGDVYLYAVDKELARVKGETHVVKPSGALPSRGVTLARIDAGANADPEPGGWRRLAAVLLNEKQVALDLQTVKLGEGKLGEFKIAHLTGTEGLKLTDAQRRELKGFVEAGGTLIIDAAGGSGAFAASIEAELAKMFGPAGASGGDILPSNHLIYEWPGAKIEQYEYRQFARQVIGNLKAPRIRAVMINRRPAVFYSREDLSAGAVGQAVDGVYGYGPATATAILRNLILYAADQGKPQPTSTSAPTTTATDQ